MSEPNRSSVFIPVLLIALAVVVWSGFQSIQLFQERSNLANLRTSQDAMFQNARKMRDQLDALAAGTQKLANSGNKNAQAVVNALAQRGITINPEEKKPQ